MSSAIYQGRFDPLAANAGKWSTIHGFGLLGFIRIAGGADPTAPGSEFSFPAGVTFANPAISPMSGYCWQTPSTKPRATQRLAAPTLYDLSTWYAASVGAFRITPTNTAKTYRLRVYCIGQGCDSGGTDNPGEDRSETVTIRDGSAWDASGTSAPVLATSGNQSGFTSGMYLTFDVAGDIAVVFANDGSGTASPNAVVSMFTWDDPPIGGGPTTYPASLLMGL